MRRLQDPNHAGLKKVLEQLLSGNVDVTVREVARRHPELKNASAFTRNEERIALITAARQQQQHARSIAAGFVSPSGPPAAVKHVGVHQTPETQALQLKLRRMVAAHAALIRAVQLAGGIGALERFWKEYKEISDTVIELDAVPANAVVLEFSQPQPPESRENHV
ncbi:MULTISPECIES: hypothetical protein [unclassified Caballeronia]|uniref:hypothetical protein n=1 Tax=unclassified Caballeronia TaxID=2646786 RepID=UPI002861A6CA|nr:MULTISPECIES: hypothetical protein [unclassified Caballeronia]MDR5777718.1 hypothetical protein [Caballeronia sp. LZ002]MDR5798884.1 hypothetical protein [Caballeronia sp. LZ001]MDR5853153.1 hypothetical protein [Caballeronia sp. LZ003]